MEQVQTHLKIKSLEYLPVLRIQLQLLLVQLLVLEQVLLEQLVQLELQKLLEQVLVLLEQELPLQHHLHRHWKIDLQNNLM